MAKKDKSLTGVIARRMRVLRKERGLTTTKLAEKVGVTQAQISRLENGQQGFRSSVLEKLAKALKVKPVAMVTEDEATLTALA